MRPETVLLHVPYVEDERRFLLQALQAALAAHRSLKNRGPSVAHQPAALVAHDGAVGGESAVELLRRQPHSSSEN